MVTWLIVGEPSGEAGLTVVPQRRPNTRNGGSCKGKGKLVKLALNVVPGSVEVKTKVGVARAAGVRFRLSGAQVRREGRVEYEDPRGEVCSRKDAEGGGAGVTCGRARQAETVSERLRREGARRHEDTRFEVEAGRPLADLRHVLGECSGLPDRAQRVEGLVEALSKMEEAVPERADTADFLKLTRDARAALDASDQGTLTEEQWGKVDRVLAACVPDFAREDSTPAERRELIQDVVAALQTVHGRAGRAFTRYSPSDRPHHRICEEATSTSVLGRVTSPMSAEEEKKEEPTKVADAEVRSPHSQASDSARSRAHSMWAGIMLELSARIELVRTQKPLHPRRRLSRKRRLRRSRWSSGPTRCATLAVLVCLASSRGRRFGGAGWPAAAAH